MKQRCGIRRIVLVLFASVCLPISALADILPMTENDMCYVIIKHCRQSNVGTGFFLYDVLEQESDRLIQSIRVERDVKVLHVEDTMDILANPETYISLQDLDGDGVDDLKVLSENGGGEGEPVYVAYLWEEEKGQFVLQDEWPTPKRSPALLWDGALIVMVAAGGIFLWRRSRRDKGEQGDSSSVSTN